MAVDVTLNSLANLDNGPSATATINANNAAITSALLGCFALDGTSPNQMNAELDMNSFNIINLPAPSTLNSPVRLSDVAGDLTINIPTTGTSGGTVPFLNGTNTWSGDQNFTGATVEVTTQTVGNNTTKAASTAFVTAAVVSAGLPTLSGLSVAAVPGTSTGVSTSVTGTANQFLGVNSSGTVLGFETLSGDATLSSGAIALATVNTNTGALGSSTAIPTITTNGKGLVTAVTTNAVVAPATTLSGTTLNSTVVSSSLTSHAKDVEFGVDLASPTTSSLQAQSTLTGTNNQAGSNFTLKGSMGTGTGAGGSILVTTSPAGTTGTAQNAGVQRVLVDSPGSVIHGNVALATTATDGFTYIATCAGTPTGVPTAHTGTLPMVYDTSGHKFWMYDTAWKGVALT